MYLSIISNQFNIQSRNMLTEEDIQEVLDKFKKLEQMRATKQKNEGRTGSSLLMMNAQIPKDFMVWWKNPNPDVELDQDNSLRPFYLCQAVKYNGAEKVSLRLTPDERQQCKIKEISGPLFDCKIDDTMDFSTNAMQGLADMVDIDELNNATLMQNLAARYNRNEIYTYVGPIILAMNPFQNLDKLLYTQQHMETYKSIIKSKTPYDDKKRLAPHIWTLTSLAYRQMMELKTKQAIVISGESGSGKTENAKRAMKFLTGLGAAHKESIKKDEVPIEQKILDTNPVLESFGNAKTVRNNNSSRFGKYVLLYFTQKEGQILGARVKNYLLEKSRVIGPAKSERNYHVFYHLLAGASDELIGQLGLQDPASKRRYLYTDLNYLKTGGDVDQTIVNDVELYKELDQQFNSLGFSAEEKLGVWRVTAAVLHMGELQFDGSSYDPSGKPCKIKNPDKLILIANLLGFQKSDDLQQELLQKGMTEMNKTVYKPYTKEECDDARDSFAKALYDNMFNWLVERMNVTILPVGEGTEQFKRETKTIGLLDIFGFENFQENNFEQMCINYVNEKLHKLYISAIFDAEKFELASEGLQEKVASLKYPSLKSLDVIKLLDEKPSAVGGKPGPGGQPQKAGLFNLVNDASTQKPRQTWEVLIKKFEDTHKISVGVFQKEKIKEKFRIRHSAKDVIYTVKTFIERNVDEISSSLETCMLTKAEPLISSIFSGKVSKAGTGDDSQDQISEKKASFGTKKTIWAKFSAQMQDLMVELAEPLFELNKDAVAGAQEEQKGDNLQKKAEPAPVMVGGVPVENCQLHFIRCIKPNEAKKSMFFVHGMTNQQITYMGVLESVDLKQKNFPYRKYYDEFYQRYEILSPLYGSCRYQNMADKSQYNFRELTIGIVEDQLKQHCKDLYAMGRKKIFMMLEVVALLDKAMWKARASRDAAAVHIKRAFSLLQGWKNAERKKTIFCKQQVVLRKKYQERVRQRGHAMFIKVLEHVSRAVSKKKEELEQVATQVFVDTYRKYVFRRAMARRIKVRQTLSKFFKKVSFILRMRKIFIAFMMTKIVVDKAFTIANQRGKDKAVRTVQRIFRGFRARDQRMPLVMEAMKAKENLKLHMAARFIQQNLRGFMVRNRLHHLHLAAMKIQAHVRMLWHRQFYIKLKSDVMTIQRCVRIFLTRRGVVKGRLAEFLVEEVNSLGKVRQYESYQLRSSTEAQQINIQYLRPPNSYSTKKLSFFTKVLDLYVMTDLSDVYPKGWANSWNKISGDCTNEDYPILYLVNGSTHSIGVNQRGKIYTWGWNDNGQCAKDESISEVIVSISSKQAFVSLQKEDLRVKQVVAAQDRNFVLLEDSQRLVAWGCNEKGQLGLGNYEDQYQPTVIEFFSRQGLKVNMVAAGGDLTLCACQNGEAFAWPFHRAGSTFSYPVKMPFSSKIKIEKVSCGFNFGFFISTQGLVYAQGSDNSEGQLGLGHIYPREIPELVASLKDIGERIETLECGYKHVIAKSSLGKIYTWGWGARGQLGLGHSDSEISPRHVIVEKCGHKERVVQIAAGFSHSIIMIDGCRDLLWFGTCGALPQGATWPTQIKLSELMPELFPDSGPASILSVSQQTDFAIVKITCSWSRSMSLTNVLIADLRQVNQQNPWKKVNQALQTITQKWEPRDVLPPYIDTFASLFHISLLKNPYNPSKAVKGGKQGSSSSGLKTPSSIASKIGTHLSQKTTSNKF